MQFTFEVGSMRGRGAGGGGGGGGGGGKEGRIGDGTQEEGVEGGLLQTTHVKRGSKKQCRYL